MSKVKLQNVPMSTGEESVNLLRSGSELLDDSGIMLDDSGDIFIYGGNTTIGLENTIVNLTIGVRWESGTVHIPGKNERDAEGNPIPIVNNLSISTELASYSIDGGYTFNGAIHSGAWLGANTIVVSATASYRRNSTGEGFSEPLMGSFDVAYRDDRINHNT